MEFNKAYNRQEFIGFLKNRFLPEDFVQTEENVDFVTQTKYSTQAVKLGTCESLDLVVYEIRHTSKNDARVSLSKEAFRLLTDEMEDRALVAFVPEDNDATYRFSFIEISLNIDEENSRISRSYSNPRRYSYLLGEGISYYTPNKYLNEKGRVVNDEDLHKRFSVEVLTNDFYGELSDWYAWAIKQIKFPNDIEDKTDDEKYNNESAIRLITRLMFVWFLKQRHLIPEEFFDEKFIAENLLKDFDPHKTEGLFKQKSLESKYYKAILQNLFFAMLNRPICEEGSQELNGRRFRKSEGDYNINYLMRYEEYFKNTQLFVDLANKTVPFLNGGLFDCLDDKDKGKYYDCFTDRKAVNKYLVFPDFLFFGEEAGKNIDLSEFYGDKKKKKVSARGIIDILKRYNFTVEENTPFDKEVSLDPELLGKVFENLLAAYNPETQTTARKQTGSFYTPREIVQYMVDESLVAHLKRTVGEDLETEYRKLLQYTDEPFELNEEQCHAIMQSLYNCKILDPACGSGAFPMGILQQMVHILQRIDPDNTNWKEMMLNLAVGETKEAFMSNISEERLELLKDIEHSFDENINRPDYARKLYLIENCIYGVDIQPIAIQISKLRFFISLVVDQKTNDNPTDNFGIRPLPNLEAKFVAANTLIGLDKIDASLFDTDEVKEKEEEMKEARHKIFGAKTVKTKRKYRQRIAEIRQELSALLEESGAVGNDGAKQLNSWDMFDQNASSPFFDPEWMFGVKDGFDIVIGNPPYGVSIKGDYRKKVVGHLGNVPDYEIYYYFIQEAERIVLENGILSYIIPNTYLFNTFAKKYRESILEKWKIIEILDCTKFPIFEKAVVRNTINTWQKQSGGNNSVGYRRTVNIFSFNGLVSQERVFMSKDGIMAMNQNWGLAFMLSNEIISLTTKLSSLSTKISSFFDVSQGYIPYRKSDLVAKYGREKGTSIVEKRLWHSPHKVDESYIREIYGRDITKYGYNSTGEYVKYGKHLACYVDLRFFSNERLLVREITNPTIIACIIKEQFVNDPQLICIIPKGNKPVNVLWAILNSKLATFYHFNHSPKATKGAFPKILVQDIKDFPLPIMSEETITILDRLVDRILQAKEQSLSANTTDWENQIDKLVYRLYGLSYDEVLIVDPDTPITREEYEQDNILE